MYCFFKYFRLREPVLIYVYFIYKFIWGQNFPERCVKQGKKPTVFGEGGNGGGKLS